jgi:hypothetical protein
VLKAEKNRRTAKRTTSKSVRQGSKKKSASRKPARRAAMFKSTNWYDRVAQSIGISAARAAS